MFAGYHGHDGMETEPSPDGAARLREALTRAEAVVLGAGAGLSTAAGYTYGGDRFYRYFRDFHERYGIRDMYSGGFYPFPRRRNALRGGRAISI